MVARQPRRRWRRRPLELRDVPVPEPGAGRGAGPGRWRTRVCRTDLHVVEGELPDPKLPLRPGPSDRRAWSKRWGRAWRASRSGDRVGVPWLGGTDGTCPYCRAGWENLCDAPTFTGYQRDGGYAEYAVARADFTLRLPDGYPDVQAAPLLCAGLIGYRALRLARRRRRSSGVARLGLYGFGASAHIVIQVARHLGEEVYVCTRGEAGQAFARELGATWAGGPDDRPPGRARQRDHLRARRARWCPTALRAGAQGRRGRLRGHPHEPDPGVRLRPAVG